MRHRLIADPHDPFGDGVFDTAWDAVSTNFLPATFPSSFPAPGHEGGSPPASAPSTIVPTPIPPEEAVQAMSAQSGSGGPGSVVAETSGGITFNLIFDAAAMAAPQSFRSGIEQAASMLSATITDKITVNIKIDYSGTGGGAAAGPDNGQYESYSSIRGDLVNDATKGDPTFNALPTGSTVQSQSQLAVWNPQLKLWGVLGANDTSTDDGSATFATDINSSLLVGVALHELTHALGRVPYGAPYGSQPDIFDLFRFTSPGTRLIDGGSTATVAYFSVDGGYTKIADYGRTSDPSDFLNSGVQGGNDPFNEFYTWSTLQSLTTADKEQLDALGFHLTTPLTTTIQTDTTSTGSTSLVQFFNNYYLQNVSNGTGPELKYGGAPVTLNQGGWAPIGTVQTSTGYLVAWKEIGVDQYTEWSVDSSGNYISNLINSESGTSLSLENAETVFHQDLNGDGVIGAPATVIATDTNSFGSIKLVEVGSNYFLENASTGTGPELQYGGTAVTLGEFVVGGSVWTPIGVVATATGYEVAWKLGSTNEYSVWATDSNGNYISNLFLPGSGTSAALEALETSFNQDLNGDGVIGLPTPVVIQTDINSFGSINLVEVGSNYFLENASTGTGPELQYGGTAVTSGEFVVAGSVWTPIGVAATAAGCEVAWKLGSTHEYSVWATDSNGNYTSNLFLPGSGTSAALEALETSFNQDLNGDGVIGLPAGTTLIQTDANSFGCTSLVHVGSNFFLQSASTGTGPELQYGGTAVTVGEFVVGGSVWAPIGAASTATGYEVAWKLGGTNEYSVWATDSSGNYTSNLFQPGSGTSSTLESLETSFKQDLNGDGVIGIPAATAPTSSTTQATSVTAVNDDTFLFHPSAGASLSPNAGRVDALEFGGDWSGTGGHLSALWYEARIGLPQAPAYSTSDGHNAVVDPSHHDGITPINPHIAELHASATFIH